MGELGLARAFQQGGDDLEVVEEAMLTCPTSCIEWVSEEELVLLEEARSDDAMARSQAQRLVRRAEGSGAGGDWRAPLRALDRAREEAARGSEFRA